MYNVPQQGETCLHNAASRGQLSRVKALVEKGGKELISAKQNVSSSFSSTYLHLQFPDSELPAGRLHLLAFGSVELSYRRRQVPGRGRGRRQGVAAFHDRCEQLLYALKIPF